MRKIRLKLTEKRTQISSNSEGQELRRTEDRGFCCSVERAARLEGPLGRSPKYLNVALRPGEDVPRRGSAAAARQVLDLRHRQFPVPDVQVGQLAHVGLRGVKASPKGVLQKWEDALACGTFLIHICFKTAATELQHVPLKLAG